MTLRTGWILAGAAALAIVSGTAAYSQQADATSSASQKTEAPAAVSQKADAESSASKKTDAESSASRSESAESSASRKTDAQSSASRKAAGFEIFNLYDFVKFPLFIAALVIFAGGFAWRIRVMRSVTRPVSAGPLQPRSVPVSAQGSRADLEFLLKGRSGLSRFLYRAGRWIRRTVFATSPVMGGVSMAFHIGLFLVPLLLPAHSVLMRQSIGAGLPTLPEPLLDKLTLVLLGMGAFFLLRRIVFPRVRALSTLRDYLVLLLVAAPFLTGYAAYHQWLAYRTVIVLHMLTGELLIALIPFTKLGHMPFLIYSRFFLSSERSFRPAARRW